MNNYHLRIGTVHAILVILLGKFIYLVFRASHFSAFVSYDVCIRSMSYDLFVKNMVSELNAASEHREIHSSDIVLNYAKPFYGILVLRSEIYVELKLKIETRSRQLELNENCIHLRLASSLITTLIEGNPPLLASTVVIMQEHQFVAIFLTCCHLNCRCCNEGLMFDDMMLDAHFTNCWHSNYGSVVLVDNDNSGIATLKDRCIIDYARMSTKSNQKT